MNVLFVHNKCPLSLKYNREATKSLGIEHFKNKMVK